MQGAIILVLVSGLPGLIWASIVNCCMNRLEKRRSKFRIPTIKLGRKFEIDNRPFSQIKKDTERVKTLKTYDINENPSYSWLLKLISVVITNPYRLHSLGEHVLPLLTPPNRIDEVSAKIIEGRKKKKQKSPDKKKDELQQQKEVMKQL